MKCPSCKTRIRSSDYQNDPWSKVDKHGEGFYACPTCGKNLVYRWAIGPSFFVSTIVFGTIAVLFSEILAFAMLWLVGMFAEPGESVSEIVTFFSYVLVAGFVCLYVVQLVEVERR